MQYYYFTTLTVNKWTPVFLDFPNTIQVILDCFTYLHNMNLTSLYAFVIMKDHIHIVWSFDQEDEVTNVLSRFKAFTGKTIICMLQEEDQNYVIKYFMVNRQDRLHKFWKIKSGCLALKHHSIIDQKINYIHLNPTRGAYKEVDNPNDYYYSSSKSYDTNTKEFSFLKFFR